MASLIINVNSLTLHSITNFHKTLSDDHELEEVSQSVTINDIISKINSDITNNDTLYLYTTIVRKSGYSYLESKNSLLHNLLSEIKKSCPAVFGKMKYIIADKQASAIRFYKSDYIIKAVSTTSVYIPNVHLNRDIISTSVKSFTDVDILNAIIQLLSFERKDSDKHLINTFKVCIQDINAERARPKVNAFLKNDEVAFPKIKLDNDITVDYDLLKLLLG